MTTRVALLRGINLGSHNRVPMARLREVCAELGFANPETHVQSGNLVFDTDLDEQESVQTVESALQGEFGFDVPVISRSAEEITAIAASHPFSDLGLDDRFLQVAFLDREPDTSVDESIEVEKYAPDRLQWDGREIYLAYPKGSARSKLNHSLLERKLAVSVTVRNWKTVSKLAEMTASRP